MYGNYILIYYTIFSKSAVFEVVASLKIIEKGVLPLDENSVGIQFYLDVENRDRLFPCKIRSWTRRCHHIDSYNNDTDDIPVYGANIHMIKPKDRDTLIYVYPAIIQENHIGSCEFILDYRCGNIKKLKRKEVSVPFDTKVKKSGSVLNRFWKRSTCASVDQDLRNYCQPVNCDLKYVGKRHFYNDKVNKCVAAPICNEDSIKELPDIVYDPERHICKDLENPLSVADIYAITSGFGIVNEPWNFNGVTVELQTNCNTISENISFLRDMMHGKLYPLYQGSVLDFSSACNSAILTIVVSILLLTFLILSLVCCINTSLWLLKKVSRDDLCKFCANIKSKFSKGHVSKCGRKNSRVNKDIKNKLLKDVIVTDLPIELRESFENICERVHREVKWKKRYRRDDLGSRINLAETNIVISATSSATHLMDNVNR